MTGYYHADDCDIDEFDQIISQRLSKADVPNASRIEKNIPIYDMAQLGDQLDALKPEWAQVFLRSAGVLVLEDAYPDTSPIDAASDAFNAIIAEERARGGKADHFAATGANDRVWNTLQKLCLQDPATHVRYFGNPVIAAVCEAWLGPNYQMTAQLNVVRPGGAAQQAHRDYHLGFMEAESCASYPAHVHELSASLTLQGGIAHCDMPVDSGPTKLLPFSQTYAPGYAAWRRDDFRTLFEESCVQLPLKKGDALFFNPALFHAAGANQSADVQRMVNLLQVSSSFGRAMENIDRRAMVLAAFEPLKSLDAAARAAAIAATVEGYAFPTNLDTDPPEGGLAPPSQADILRRALDEDWDTAQLMQALDAQAARQSP
ncbi:ectoine hydroxylase-related dioxygenase (phytanoyl-CoA dioxygenase family) [Litoreibacter ponti]|uniref:Ectoine hydroxylase-related dioxygenase (Phytanoyl-CoA dioxygenase family) n=1 Tax=Litoreibacter ponti TaxID=1510457 RepID=A0A2T6BMT9_9RHOB|nr:phytanoyl-CoA dioxygenase family protein [Litoreibacter ponti]PTX57376.1 ectoine hydroxylase-related dioxygenase (phytanoyl-CoA dioxygenase family) [Litoreibacter ponti]